MVSYVMSHFVESFAFCLPCLMSHCFMSVLLVRVIVTCLVSSYVWFHIMFLFCLKSESCLFQLRL
jgi:hypothetical protein